MEKRALTLALSALFLAMPALNGCAKVDVQKVIPGQDTEQKVVKLFGPPVERQESTLKPGVALLKYGDDTQFQVEKGLITGTMRPPVGGEITLQYWRHEWRGREQVYEPAQGGNDAHGPQTYVLKAPALGASVVYDPQLDRVTKVVRYGAR